VIKKAFLVLTLFLLSFGVFLVANLPASVAWNHGVLPYTSVKSSKVVAKAFSGTVWNGQAHIVYRHVEGVLSWDLKMRELLLGRLPVELSLHSTVGELDANLEAGVFNQKLVIDSARIDMPKLNPFFRAKRIKLDGELFAKNIEVQLDEQVLASIDGRFNWSGGAVAYPAGREIHERNMPAFSGQVTTRENGDLYLGIKDQDASFDVMRGSWDASGTVLWEVTRRVLDIADEPWSANSEETDVVFKLKKPISREVTKL